MKIIVTLIFLWVSISCFCQSTDTLKPVELQSVLVTAYKEEPIEQTSLNITPLRIDSISRLGNFNLTDLMAKTPGIQMLSTGVAIAKPVIRGLYGNRVLVLLSGLKFDNQQWQEEHGLGLSDAGLSKVEIIKGPMSVLYGTEAIGGIINVIEEDKPLPGKKESDISLRFNSNTLGGILQCGYKVNHGNNWWRIRGEIENNADYSDGNGDRVLNSRFKGYGFKATYGFQKKNWTSTNNFLSSFNQYGFIFNDIYEFVEPDERWSRDLSENPAHLVLLNILSSENKFYFKNDSKLSVSIGVQSNERLENEGGGAISLNMHLLTIQYLAKWENQISKSSRLILSNLGSFEDNTNFGSRKIVPDAHLQESNISGYIETALKHKWTFENGAGVGEKWIQTFFTPTIHGQDKEIEPFSKLSWYYNFFSGITYFPNHKINLKFNVATGVRIPNLAELSSDGLHEGVFTYEIGDPTLKNELNLAFNFVANYQNSFVEFSITPFYNYNFDYVYLSPTDEEWFGFPVYRYRQQNARQYGTEVILNFLPVHYIRTGISYAGMISNTEDNNYTPFNPAQKLSPSIEYTMKGKSIDNFHFFSTFDYYFAQDHIAPHELATPEYGIWNLGVSVDLQGQKVKNMVGLTINNITDTAYYDHLSRLKYFGLLNIGRNVVLNYKITFDGNAKRK